MTDPYELTGCCCVGDRVIGTGDDFQELHTGAAQSLRCECGGVVQVFAAPFGSDGAALPDPFR